MYCLVKVIIRAGSSTFQCDCILNQCSTLYNAYFCESAIPTPSARHNVEGLYAVLAVIAWAKLQ